MSIYDSCTPHVCSHTLIPSIYILPAAQEATALWRRTKPLLQLTCASLSRSEKSLQQQHTISLSASPLAACRVSEAIGSALLYSQVEAGYRVAFEVLEYDCRSNSLEASVEASALTSRTSAIISASVLVQVPP
jgi:hypothetical protein